MPTPKKRIAVEARKRERLEALIAFSTGRQPLIDWNVLANVDRLASGAE